MQQKEPAATTINEVLNQKIDKKIALATEGFTSDMRRYGPVLLRIAYSLVQMHELLLQESSHTVTIVYEVIAVQQYSMNFLLSIDVYSYIMTTEDTTVSKSSQKDKEDPSTTLSAETGEDNITKPSGEKKVVVVTPTKGQYIESQVQRQEMERNKEESISDKAKEAAQSLKSQVKPANSKKVTSSVKSHSQTDVDINLEYNRILVPHDGSEMSDKALNHAIYLSQVIERRDCYPKRTSTYAE